MPSRPCPAGRSVVFGGSGFIGSHLVSRLAEMGVECVSYDIHEPAKSLVGVEYVSASVLEEEDVRAAIRGASNVFAFAGRSGAAGGLAQAETDLQLNCRAQLLLLEAVRAESPEARVIFPGSRLEYGPPLYLPIDESHPVNPQSVYALHKFTAGRYHLMYQRDYGVRSTVLRISNPFGPHAEMKSGSYSVLNYMMDLALRGDTIQVFGSGEQTRDYIYITDLVDAIMAAAASPNSVGRVLNIGSGQPTSLISAARAIVRLAGRGTIESVEWPEEWQKVETGDAYFSIDLARELLSWEPSTDLESGISRTLSALRA